MTREGARLAFLIASNERHIFRAYLVALFRYSPQRFLLNCALSILNAAFSGIGLLTLIPILHASGWLVRQEASSSSLSFLKFIEQLHIGLVPALGIFLGLLFCATVLEFLFRHQSNAFRLSYMLNLQNRLNTSLAEAKWSYLVGRRLQDFQLLMTVAIPHTGALTYLALQALGEICLVVICFWLSFLVSWKTTLFVSVVALLPVLLTSSRKVFTQGKKLFLSERNLHSHVTTFLGGIKVAKSGNLTSNYIERFSQLEKKVYDQNLAYVRHEGRLRLLYSLSAAGISAVLFYVALQVVHLPLANLLTLFMLFSRIAPRISAIQQMHMKMVSLVPAYLQVEQAIADLTAEREQSVPGPTPRLTREIQFDRVSFFYGSRKVLCNLTFSIPYGKTTAIVGPSGAGKSTVADLLLGLLAPATGTITVDGVPLTQEVLRGWRSIVAYVPRDPYLFNDTVRANLNWGEAPFSDQELWRVLKLASADGFVEKLTLQLDSPVGERGEQLSAGERQRLVLARALLRRPKVLLFDESTNSLDVKNEERVLEALSKYDQTLTRIVISHRYSSVRTADKVIVLDDGILVEEGAPNQLSQKVTSPFSQLFGREDTHAIEPHLN